MSRIIIALIFICIATYKGFSQSNYVYIDSIAVKGNKVTQTSTVYREMHLQVGDSILQSELMAILKKNEVLLLNTALFNSIQIKVKDWQPNNHLILEVAAKEAWYIYPVPIIEISDRNFNVWWVEHNRTLRRLNYGLDTYHNNLTGRRDRLKFLFQFGYVPKYDFNYNLPYLNKAKTLGMSAGFYYAKNKEINFATSENKLQFITDEKRYALRRFRAGVGFTYRKKIYTSQSFVAEYHDISVTDTIGKLNPDYFLEGKTRQRFFRFLYQFTHDNRNVRNFATDGWVFNTTVQKDGFSSKNDVNSLYTSASFSQYFTLQEKWLFAYTMKARTALFRQKQPYNLNRALGYGLDFVRGYQYYVVDGLDFGLLRTDLRYQLWSGKLDFGKYMDRKNAPAIPLRYFLRLSADTGYANEPFYKKQNPLSNQLLYGGGIGVDVVALRDKVLQVEYDINHLGQKGVFFQFQIGF
jgi:outer membrane protein assembly factor BamA